jgi:hypothetical protein
MRAGAHDPSKCVRFDDKIMRLFKKWERDRTQNRRPLLLIALTHAPLLTAWAIAGFE